MKHKPLSDAICGGTQIDIESESHTLFSRVLYQLSYLAWTEARPGPCQREG